MASEPTWWKEARALGWVTYYPSHTVCQECGERPEWNRRRDEHPGFSDSLCSPCLAEWLGARAEVEAARATAPAGVRGGGYRDGDPCPNGCGPMHAVRLTAVDCLACGERKYPRTKVKR